jgi:penicillin-binding protein 2
LGYLQKSDPMKQEDAKDFSYHKVDFKGVSGIERIYDDVLRGDAGAKSILINNLMFRQEEKVFVEPEPGDNLYLTLDARIQLASEEALASMGTNTMGAVVVMDVNNGDVLAMASAPTYDPNEFAERFNEIDSDPLLPQLNRAAYGIYAPGSIFKMVVGLAFLENGVDPNKVYDSLGYKLLKGRLIKDTAEAGQYDFYRAFAKSSNSYFIDHGLEVGIETLIDWGDRFFIGQKTGLLPRQESGGSFPSLERVRKGWHEGETANLCIGQGAIAVTPLQMAVMTAAVANGGTVYKPRIASRVEPQRAMMSRQGRAFPAGVIRGRIGASKRVIQILHDAMLLDVAGFEGSGRKARVEGLNIGGKTGTAETNKRINGRKINDTWFASFAPVEDPKYAVVVLVVDGISGSQSCAPIARQIYEVIRDLDDSPELSRRNRSVGNLLSANDSF